MARKSKKSIRSEALGRLKNRVSAWQAYYSVNIFNYRQDLKFVYEEDAQWTTDEINEYDVENRPRMTFNMLPRYITNMAAEFAENVPDVEVRSEHFTEVAQETIDLTTNILRNISLDSRNNLVYKNAAQCAWTGGYGAFRITIDREHPTSFNFVPRYEAIFDPTLAFWDPKAKKTDKSDGDFCGTTISLSKEEFKAKYPGALIPSGNFLEEDGFVWMTKDTVTLVDYWERVPVKVSMALLSDNTVVKEADADETIRMKNKQLRLQNQGAIGVQKITIMKTEVMIDHKLVFYRASSEEILEDHEWDGKKLPIIFMGGIVKRIQGRERTFGLIHWMKAPQRAYNYARSEYLYRLQLTRYEKFIVTTSMIANNQKAWKNPHKSQSALVVDPQPNGQMPTVIPPLSIGSDLLNEMSRSLGDLQLIPGRFEANFGAQGNETSGIAITNRQSGGNLNVKEFFDNAFDAIESGIRVVADMLPRVFDTSRRISTTTRDGQSDNTLINTNEQNTLSSVFFNIKLKVGSSFAIQQQENVSKLIELTRSDPALAKLTSDIIVKNLDLQHGPQLEERIQRWSIPAIAASEGSKDPLVIQNAQQAQQNPAAQLAQQNAQLELQGKTIELQKQKQDLMIAQMAATDDRMRALAAQAQANAAVQNADTNQAEALVAGAQNSRKMQLEENRTRVLQQQEELKLAQEISQERGF